MLRAEERGVRAMFETNTIRVPKPLCTGTTTSKAYVAFEYLKMGGRGAPREMGKQLARMHRCTAPNGKYGFDINNTCGETVQVLALPLLTLYHTNQQQINPWKETWVEFWDEARLGHMFKLARRNGGRFQKENELREKVALLLS